jgi:hypothetical protein
VTLIEIVREFCARRGLSRPAAAVGSANAGEAQYAGLMNEMLDEITSRKAFRGITKEKVHTTIANANQGDIKTLTDAGFQNILPDTFWNRTSGIQIKMGLTPEEWQALQVTGTASGPSYAARLRGSNLYTYPIPPAGLTWAFEYKTVFAVTDGANGASKQYFTRDDDTCFIFDKICLSWLNYAWKREKGFEHAEAQRMFEGQLAELMASDLSPRAVDLAGRPTTRMGLIIPEGSWPL